MKPEAEWFREPAFYFCGHAGDCKRYVWVAEPEKDNGVFGVAYYISHRLLMEFENIETFMKEASLRELHRRIEANGVKDKHPEGSLFDVFDWQPIFMRNEEGRVWLQGDEGHYIEAQRV